MWLRGTAAWPEVNAEHKLLGLSGSKPEELNVLKARGLVLSHKTEVEVVNLVALGIVPSEGKNSYVCVK